MPDAVCDTTPIICLLKIGKLDLLRSLYGSIAIPEAVLSEVEQGREKGYYQNLNSVEWVHILPLQNKELMTGLSGLDAGEAEAIALAIETEAPLIILDEKLGRERAKAHGLKVTGTLGVLLRARCEGLIDRLAPLLFELMEKDVWLDGRLVSEVLRRAGETTD